MTDDSSVLHEGSKLTTGEVIRRINGTASPLKDIWAVFEDRMAQLVLDTFQMEQSTSAVTFPKKKHNQFTHEVEPDYSKYRFTANKWKRTMVDVSGIPLPSDDPKNVSSRDAPATSLSLRTESLQESEAAVSSTSEKMNKSAVSSEDAINSTSTNISESRVCIFFKNSGCCWMVNVSVKWRKETYDVEVDSTQTPLVFKSQLFALTSVLPERQKVLVKGKTVGDDSWDGIPLADGLQFMLMGSTAPIPQAPVAAVVEASKKEDAPKQLFPLGLVNIGNTCYFNSVVQSLQTIKELRALASKVSFNDRPLVNSIGRVLRDVNELTFPGQKSLNPAESVLFLKKAFPQFATTFQGGPEQQDANEFYTVLLQEILTATDQIQPEAGNPKLRSLFQGTLKTTLKCDESPEEPVKQETENVFQVPCFLKQGVSNVHTGIIEGLKETLEKTSEKLGRNANWTKESRFDRLPKYLTIQMVRFFYKENAQTSAKILKEVKFPPMLDMYQMCTPEMQKQFKPMRDAIKDEEDAKLERERRKKLMSHEEQQNFKDDGVLLPTDFDNNPGCNNSGFYQLKAVVTHKGRTVKSGHYVAWIRNDDNQWVLCDDDNVTVVEEMDVLKTAGGGDWHTAYILLYEARQIKKYPQLAPEPAQVE